MAFEIKCKDIGNEECNWSAISGTEDRLVDYVAVHARDQHGVKEFTQEMIATVKNSLGNTTVPIVDEEEPIMRIYTCANCSWKYIAQTEDLIVDAAAVHARDTHGVREFTKEMGREVVGSLREWTGISGKSEGCGCHC